MNYLITSIFILIFCTYSNGQTITWTGGGDGNSWSDQDNWMPNNLPQLSDTVLIIGATVKADAAFSEVAKITLVNANLLVLNSLFVVNDDNMALTLDNSNLDNQGLLKIKGAGTIGMKITNGSSFINDSRCEIGLCGTIGILNENLVENRGLLILSEIDNIGIENATSISMLINEDSIIIDQVGFKGISNLGQAQIDNKIHASISISNILSPTTSFAIINEGSLLNNGKISLANMPDNGMLCFGTNSTLINHDSIIISNDAKQAFLMYGNSADSAFYNTGLILIDGMHATGSRGFYIRVHSINSGTIMVRQVDSFAFWCQSCTFRNEALVSVDSSGTALSINSASGPASIYNAAGAMIHLNRGESGMNIIDTFTNEGLITIKNCGNYGILSRLNAVFRNNGNIEITDTPAIERMIYIRDDASFKNDTLGQITISVNQALSENILIRDQSSLTNHGQIHLMAGTGLVLRMNGNTHFLNSTVGQIYLQNNVEDKLEIEVPAVFENFGLFEIP